MSELTLTRHLKADQSKVFDYISKPEKILEWWGPEGVTVPVHDLTLGETGPWMSEMHGSNGNIYTVSGEVTRVDPPNRIGFTWAWHDPEGARGHESHVMIELTPKDGGTEFKLTHTELSDEESARNHEEGWTSSIGRLVKLLNT